MNTEIIVELLLIVFAFSSGLYLGIRLPDETNERPKDTDSSHP